MSSDLIYSEPFADHDLYAGTRQFFCLALEVDGIHYVNPEADGTDSVIINYMVGLRVDDYGRCVFDSEGFCSCRVTGPPPLTFKETLCELCWISDGRIRGTNWGTCPHDEKEK